MQVRICFGSVGMAIYVDGVLVKECKGAIAPNEICHAVGVEDALCIQMVGNDPDFKYPEKFSDIEILDSPPAEVKTEKKESTLKVVK
jgi:hypothetical protein